MSSADLEKLGGEGVTVQIDEGRQTLVEVIKEWILPGTTIVSDYLKAYDCLEDEGFQHLKVNHSINFKDPETGAHTNNIEASWRAAKAITTSAGRKKAHIPGNLAKYMFHKICAIKGVDRTEEFFKLAGLFYNPANDDQQVPLNENEIPEEDLEVDMIDV